MVQNVQTLYLIPTNNHLTNKKTRYLAELDAFIWPIFTQSIGEISIAFGPLSPSTLLNSTLSPSTT